uniref:Uncharacterized protein n=1 Tax=viral metagenome TaxID=1070528 RepID=A0A6C0CLZ9_9ZZZZ
MSAAGPGDTNTTEESGTEHETAAGTFAEGEVEGEGEPGDRIPSAKRPPSVPNRPPSVPQRPKLDRPSKPRDVPPDSNRIPLWNLLTDETKSILGGAAPDKRKDVQYSRQVPQNGNIAYESKNKYPEHVLSHYRNETIDVYSAHPRIGHSSEYGFTHKFPFLDGPIVENSHLLTSIVLGATGSNPRILIAFVLIQPTYDIHVFSSKSSEATTYTSDSAISKILSEAFIIIHVDYNDSPDKTFMTTLKPLCKPNKAYIHFYSITKGNNGRIIKRDGLDHETLYLKDINSAHVARVVYTAVHYHCFKSE